MCHDALPVVQNILAEIGLLDPDADDEIRIVSVPGKDGPRIKIGVGQWLMPTYRRKAIGSVPGFQGLFDYTMHEFPAWNITVADHTVDCESLQDAITKIVALDFQYLIAAACNALDFDDPCKHGEPVIIPCT